MHTFTLVCNISQRESNYRITKNEHENERKKTRIANKLVARSVLGIDFVAIATIMTSIINIVTVATNSFYSLALFAKFIMITLK